MYYKDVNQPGTIISIDMGLYNHIALVTDTIVAGLPTVISLSEEHKTVVEEPWLRAVGQRRVRLYSEQGRLSPHEVVRKARSFIGRIKWSWLFNCEHFARAIHGLDVKSPELRKLAGKSLLVAAAIWALSKISK